MTAVCCPGHVPCRDHRMRKSELVDELQRTRAELAAARELLAAIAEMAEMPQARSTFDWAKESEAREAIWMRGIRIRGAAVYPTAGSPETYRSAMAVLLEHKDEPVPYEIYVPDAKLAEATQ